MDELTLLRSVRSDVGRATPETLANGREALLASIAEPASSTRPGRATRAVRNRRVRLVGGASLLAGGVAAALVLVNVTGVGGGVTGSHVGAAPAAAEVLQQAASSTIRASDPAVGAGQFLEVATTGVFTAGTQGENGKTVTYLVSQDGQMYIPADTTGTWVWVRDAETTVQTFGAASERAAEHDEADRSPGEYVTGKGGDFYGSPLDPSLAELQALPTDPEALLARIHELTKGLGTSADAEAFQWIADALRSGIVPADVRAAMYRAAALIPGIRVTDRTANLPGTTGTAIGYTDRVGTRQEIIVDPSSGLLIGEREVATGAVAASWGVPEGTAIGWTAVTTSVVGAAPAHG